MILESGFARLEIDPERGGRIASLSIGGLEVLITSGESALHWGCYSMAPWAGRIRNGRFNYEGLEYQLPLRMPPHAIHGTVLDRPVEIESSDKASCRLRVDLGPDWPWPGYVEQSFSLSPAGLHSRLGVHAEDRAFPASIGWHPWLRRRLARGGPAELDFEANVMYERDAFQIPTGALRAPSPGPRDDCFTQVVRGPKLRWPGALEITLRSTLDHWVVFDEPEDAICVEPQSAPPDALNLQPYIVSPGHPLVGDFWLEWTLD